MPIMILCMATMKTLIINAQIRDLQETFAVAKKSVSVHACACVWLLITTHVK